MRKAYHQLDDEDLARICHEAHIALRIGLNDSADDVHWDALPRKRKERVINEVRLIREGKKPAEIHQAWIDSLIADGWRYGPSRNLIQKTHPDLVSYDKLPPEEKAKVRQAIRIVFTHILPSPAEVIAFRDIRTIPGADETVIREDLPEVCITHGHFYPCGGITGNCVMSTDPVDVDTVYRLRYEE